MNASGPTPKSESAGYKPTGILISPQIANANPATSNWDYATLRQNVAGFLDDRLDMVRDAKNHAGIVSYIKSIAGNNGLTDAHARQALLDYHDKKVGISGRISHERYVPESDRAELSSILAKTPAVKPANDNGLRKWVYRAAAGIAAALTVGVIAAYAMGGGSNPAYAQGRAGRQSVTIPIIEAPTSQHRVRVVPPGIRASAMPPRVAPPPQAPPESGEAQPYASGPPSVSDTVPLFVGRPGETPRAAPRAVGPPKILVPRPAESQPVYTRPSSSAPAAAPAARARPATLEGKLTADSVRFRTKAEIFGTDDHNCLTGYNINTEPRRENCSILAGPTGGAKIERLPSGNYKLTLDYKFDSKRKNAPKTKLFVLGSFVEMWKQNRGRAGRFLPAYDAISLTLNGQEYLSLVSGTKSAYIGAVLDPIYKNDFVKGKVGTASFGIDGHKLAVKPGPTKVVTAPRVVPAPIQETRAPAPTPEPVPPRVEPAAGPLQVGPIITPLLTAKPQPVDIGLSHMPLQFYVETSETVDKPKG
jgi:hypothetical protein